MAKKNEKKKSCFHRFSRESVKVLGSLCELVSPGHFHDVWRGIQDHGGSMRVGPQRLMRERGMSYVVNGGLRVRQRMDRVRAAQHELYWLALLVGSQRIFSDSH